MGEKRGRGRPFPKGVSGNPAGKPALPDDIKAGRKLTQMEFERAANRFLYCDKSTIAKASQDPEATMLELLIASIIHKAVVQGVEKRMTFLLDRLIGKVKDRSEIEISPLVERAEHLAKRPVNEIIQITENALAKLKKEQKE